MGFLDRLAGRPKQDAKPQEEAQPAPAQPPSEPSLASTSGSSSSGLPESSSFGPPKFDAPPTLAPGLTMGADVSSGLPPGRLYDPWSEAGLNSAVIGTKKHAFKLPTQPEFVFEEEAAVKRRGWSENLQFYTGLGYLAGGGTGVASGLYTYATVKPEIPLQSLRLQANRVLNLAGSKAKPYSNSTAILGLFFSSFESYLSSTLDDPGIPDEVSTVLAGALSGALFRSPRGPRQAAAAAAVGVVAGGGVATLRKFFPSL